MTYNDYKITRNYSTRKVYEKNYKNYGLMFIVKHKNLFNFFHQLNSENI